MSWIRCKSADFLEMLLALGEVFNEPVSDRARGDVSAAGRGFAVRCDRGRRRRTMAALPRSSQAGDFARPWKGTVEDQAELAWQHTLREIPAGRLVGTPSWPDEVTARAAPGLFGGSWRTLCENLPARGPELLGFRKQFVSAFGATARQAMAAAALPPSRSEAKAALADLKKALRGRGLPSGDSVSRGCCVWDDVAR